MATVAAAQEEQPATRFAKDHLKAFVERIERLEEEKKAIADDIRDVYAEAKGTGFDVKALRSTRVASSMAIAAAPGMTAPVLSVTVPASVPVCCCASAVALATQIRMKGASNDARMRDFPGILRTPSLEVTNRRGGWTGAA